MGERSVWQAKVLLTVVFIAVIAFMLAIDIWFAVCGHGSEQNLLGILNGAIVAWMLAVYYSIFKSIDDSGNTENLPSERLEKLIRKAVYIAKTNKQWIELEHFPITYFKGRDFSTSIISGCSIFTKGPEVEFVLRHRAVNEGSVRVQIMSRRTPIELAPAWLKASKSYKVAIKESIAELKSEMKEKCKTASIKMLEKSL